MQRPEGGVKAQFSDKTAPKTSRYDSASRAVLGWDAWRAFAGWPLALVAGAAEKSAVFAMPQVSA